MQKVRIGDRLVLRPDFDSKTSTFILAAVPDKEVSIIADQISVNLINIGNGNRWNDNLYTVESPTAYDEGLDLDFIKETILDLGCMEVVEVIRMEK